MRTPIANARIGGCTCRANSTTPAIIPTFTTAGPMEAAKKWPWIWSTPIASAARPTSGRYGNITRVRRTARSACAASSVNPGAMTRRIHGAPTMPTIVVTPSARIAAPSTARTMPTNSSRGRVSTYSLKTGTTAVESAPSASRRRSMFGIRKATKNASVTGPAPKTSATTMSRTNPSTRERNVAPLMDPSARTTWRSTLMALTSSADHCPGNRGTDTASCGVHISTREESQVGEHQVGHETNQAEREPPDPQPYRSLQGPDRGQDGANGRHRGGWRRSHRCSRGHPRARQGGHQGCDPPQHRGPQEVGARPPSGRPQVVSAVLALGQEVEQSDGRAGHSLPRPRSIDTRAGNVARLDRVLRGEEISEIIVRHPGDEERRCLQIPLDAVGRHPHDVAGELEIRRAEHRAMNRVVPEDGDRRSCGRHHFQDCERSVDRPVHTAGRQGRTGFRQDADVRG